MNRLPISQVTIPEGPDADLVKRVEAAYDATPGISRAPEKEVRFAENFRVWGTDVAARTGIVAAPLERRSLLVQLLASVVARLHADKKTL